MICKSNTLWHALQKQKLSPMVTWNDVPIEDKAWKNHMASILKKKKELEKSKDCGIMSMLLIVLDNLKDWHDKHKILSYWLKAQAKIKSELSMAVLK